jgi:hypothetical protein
VDPPKLPFGKAVGVENVDEILAPRNEQRRGWGAYAESGATVEYFAESA